MYAIIEEEFNNSCGFEKIYKKPEIVKTGFFKWRLSLDVRDWLEEQKKEWVKFFSLSEESATVRYSINGYCIRRRIVKIGDIRD